MPAHAHRQVQERHHLVEERLGGRYRDLVAARQGQVAVGGDHERRADDVDQRQHLDAALPGDVEGVEHVLGLAGLAHEHPDVLGPEGGAVLGDELRRQHRHRGASGQPRQVHRPQHAGVVGGAAGDEVEVPRLAHLLDVAGDVHGGVQQVQQLAGHLGLLVDLLEHEVRVAALLGRLHGLDDLLGLALDGLAVGDPHQLDAARPRGWRSPRRGCAGCGG